MNAARILSIICILCGVATLPLLIFFLLYSVQFWLLADALSRRANTSQPGTVNLAGQKNRRSFILITATLLIGLYDAVATYQLWDGLGRHTVSGGMPLSDALLLVAVIVVTLLTLGLYYNKFTSK